MTGGKKGRTTKFHRDPGPLRAKARKLTHRSETRNPFFHGRGFRMDSRFVLSCSYDRLRGRPPRNDNLCERRLSSLSPEKIENTFYRFVGVQCSRELAPLAK